MKFILNLMFNTWFYVGVVAVVAVMYFFPWLSIGSLELPTIPTIHFTTSKATKKIYVPKRTVSNMIIWVTYANITIWQNQHRNTGIKNIDFDNDFEAMIGLKASILELMNRDFIEMMDNSTNKESTLRSYINQIETLLQQSESVYSTTAAKVQDWQVNYDACTVNKAIADEQYIIAINQEDVSSINMILQDAEEYGKCQTNYRIKINSYLLPLEELNIVREVATSYTLILNERFTTLAEYYELLRGDILEELNQTKLQFWL